MRSRIVAPSLVMVTSPSGDTIILSSPLGPSDVRSVDAMERAAMMCDCWAAVAVAAAAGGAQEESEGRERGGGEWSRFEVCALSSNEAAVPKGEPV